MRREEASEASADNVELDLSTEEACRRSAEAFYDWCAFRASTLLVQRARQELTAQGKRLLVLLS
ncbi:hypothetical protein GCM10023317_27720 [Actinopolymorpha pittospori]